MLVFLLDNTSPDAGLFTVQHRYRKPLVSLPTYMKYNLGLLYALGAYTCWGLFPIFWKQIDHIDTLEIVLHRMLWSFVLVTVLILMMGQGRTLLSLLHQRKLLLRLGFASVVVSFNWGIFIWAVNNERILEASMGYFINPLITVLFGVILFGERLRSGQLLSLVIMTAGVLVTVIAYGKLPWIALSLALSFAVYSVVKKTIRIPATHGLALETALMFLPALAYLIVLSSQGRGEFGVDWSTNTMLILSGFFTLVPLLLFASAAKRISMTALGMTQYIGPTLQLLIGVLIYKEAFELQQLISFGLIWFALVIYSLDQVKQQKSRRRLQTGI